jgi:hypothetical protein
MKTPREILLNRHQAASAGLDSVRKQVLVTECRSEAKNSGLGSTRSQALPLRVALKLWSELILPARHIWGGLAFVWLLIFIVNLAESSRTGGELAKSNTESIELLAVWRQQQRLAQLTDAVPGSSQKNQTTVPRPRSEQQPFRRTI